MRLTLLSVLACAACLGDEDFERYAVDGFPSPYWQDAGLVDPIEPNPPAPSCVVVETTDAFGETTRALSFVDAFAPSTGIYRGITPSTTIRVRADVRVDQLADMSVSPTNDWAVEVGAGLFSGSLDLANIHQIGVYSSSQTATWRLYSFGTLSGFSDTELGVPVVIEQWVTIDVDIDTEAGTAGCLIIDTASGDVLLDQVVTIEGWLAEDGPFDTVNIIDGEFSKENTVNNLAVVDNVSFTDQTGCMADCNGDGALNILDFVCFQNLFVAGCP